MSTEQIVRSGLVDAFQAVQLKFSREHSDSETQRVKYQPPLQFMPSKPAAKIEVHPEKREALENAMFEYIVDKYDSVLTEKQKRLLMPNIEAYMLNQTFLFDPNDEMYRIHRLVHEAGEVVMNTSRERTQRSAPTGKN